MLKRLLLVWSIAMASAPVLAADIGVSIGVNQPGLYGRVDIGNFPEPRVVYAQPVIVMPAPVAVVRQPIYLYVPPGHQRDWAKHCGNYNACGQPVYFVQENWYREVYAPRYYEQRRDRDEWRREQWRERDERHGRDRGDHERGGRGRGHD